MHQTPNSPPTDDLPIPPRYWWLKRIAIAVGLLIVGLVVLRLWWGHIVDRRIDAMIARYHAAGDPILPEDFVIEPISDEENAAWYYTQAGHSITTPADLKISLDDLIKDSQLRLEHQEAVQTILHENKTALEMARHARDLTLAHWTIDPSKPLISNWIPSFSHHRNGIKLLALTAEDHLQTGRPLEAANCVADLLAWTSTLESFPSLIAHLVALSGDMMACDILERAGPSIVAMPEESSVLQLSTQLQDKQRLNAGWRLAIQMERAFFVDTYRRLGDGTLSSIALARTQTLRAAARRERTIGLFVGPAIRSCSLEFEAFSDAMEKAGLQSNFQDSRAFSGGPWLVRPTGVSPIEHFRWWAKRLVLPALDRYVFIHFRALTRRILAATALAVHRYELDHGHRPDSLDQLVPNYLPVIPADPFHPQNAAIRYLPNTPHPRLYSVGPNGVDDNGMYEFSERGVIQYEALDIPFFLDGPPSEREQDEGESTDQQGPDVKQHEEDSRDDDKGQHNNQAPQDRGSNRNHER